MIHIDPLFRQMNNTMQHLHISLLISLVWITETLFSKWINVNEVVTCVIILILQHLNQLRHIFRSCISRYKKVSGEGQVRGCCLSAGRLLFHPFPPQGVKTRLTWVTCWCDMRGVRAGSASGVRLLSGSSNTGGMCQSSGVTEPWCNVSVWDVQQCTNVLWVFTGLRLTCQIWSNLTSSMVWVDPLRARRCEFCYLKLERTFTPSVKMLIV